jgi:hypothetical protein
MQLEQNIRLSWIMGCVGSWSELWISKFSQYRFERIGPALRNVGVEGPLIPRHCLGQGTRVCL